MYKLPFIMIILFLTACTTIDTRWLHEDEGNQFETISGRANKARFVSVNNKLKTWNGPYRGGKERIDDRKIFLTQLAEDEAVRVCEDAGYLGDNNPEFVMQDTSGSAYGGGLLGEFIAAITAKNENIPISIYYEFICTDEQNSQEKLAQRG